MSATEIAQDTFRAQYDGYLDVDGVGNAVEEVWTESLPPGPENPVGNAEPRALRASRAATVFPVSFASARMVRTTRPSPSLCTI